MRYLTAILLFLCLSLGPVGCSRTIVQADNPAAVPADEYRKTFEAAIQVLRDNGFTIDRRDYRFGRITTLPLGSPNLFEVWNTQNTTRQQAVESTLADEQRRVNISLTPPGTPGSPDQLDGFDHTSPTAGYLLKVAVILERKQIPTRRLAGSARRNVFSNLAAPPRNLIDRGVTNSYWQPVGQDPYLEARLIKQIMEQVEQTTPRRSDSP